ncbi:MAG TPA: FlgD immunoglobulin-like domain containing protein [Candidatus Saccharimonadaceae bacterium]|jgi:hypothetical protein|nr:FlgD immunoglobulin-like domain containing protein [Candidatus Saccharimonadaceae bacterium]
MLAKPLAIAVVLLLCPLVASAAFVQQGPKLVASDASGQPHEGTSVALSADGNTAIVGGPFDNGSGAAWIYTRSGGAWTQQGPKLVGTGVASVAAQGWSVALSADGNTALVGGYFDNSSTGAVWVFTRSGGVWTQQGPKLVGTGAVGTASQGWSVALSADGNTALVGGYTDNSNAGAVWVYTRSGGVWTQQGGKLVGSGAVGSADQGTSVALSADGNTAIVGGYTDASFSGATWVFTRSGGVWSQQGGKLVGSGAIGNALEGSSVALSADGNTAVIGGYGDNSVTGAAWVFTRGGGVWTQQGGKLVGTGATGSAFQGSSVGLSADGNTALVGADGDNSNIGAAWVYVRHGGAWSQLGPKVVGSSAVGAAEEGASAALSADGQTAMLGGFGDNSATGAAWVFTDHAPEIMAIADVRNDQGRQVRLSFGASRLDALGSPTPILGYYIYRREAIALAMLTSTVPGPASLPDQAQLAGWDYVMTVPATTDDVYQTVVPTLADSNSTGFHRTALFVRAATATPGIFFDSAVDSGYSVDNLPPVPPAPFTAAYASGATHLHWGPNREVDLWYYKLYRGSSAGFVPGASNLVANLPDTGYADVGPAGSYYKLSAVDVNGNESATSLVTPSATTGVDDAALPGELALATPRPNPARASTLLSFALPHAGPVSLEVYDMAGRHVRTVSAGPLEAGVHALPFDLRDDAGRPEPDGLYFVRLEAAGHTVVERLSIVR